MEGRTDLAVQLLQGEAARSGVDPAAAVLAEEMIAVELAASHGGARRHEAIAAAGRALALDDRSFRARLLLALLLAGDRDAALGEIHALAAARPLQPDDVSELFLKDIGAWMLAILTDGRPLPGEQPPAARRALAALLDHVATRHLGGSRRRLKQWARGELRQARLSRAATPTAADLELEVHLCWDLLDFPAAIELLQERTASAPGDATARLLLLRTLNRVGRYGEAVRLGAPPVEVCPPCRQALAEAHFKLGDGGDLPLLQELHRRYPEQAEVTALLGATLVRQGLPEQGVALLEQSLARAPDDMPTLNLLAATLSRLGQHDRAAEAALRYRSRHDRQEQRTRDAELQDNIDSTHEEAAAALDRGETERARQLIAIIGVRSPRYPLLPLLRLALALRRGEPPSAEDAEQLLEAALTPNGWLWEKR
ncbi:MAG: hypothetical protein FJ125_06070 [Deltaproteobacteria bacterium]|nr:hypothetical protein [Deltaproteobacteria bacterium]